MSERPTGCPDPAALAAYLDGTLPRADHEGVQSHVAACAVCTELVAEVLMTGGGALIDQADSGPEGAWRPRRSWTRGRVAAGMTAAAAVLAAALFVPESWIPLRTGEPALADLADAAGLGRPVEGRLTGGFTHHPWSAPTAGGQGGAMTRSTAIQLVAGKIREAVESRGTAPRLHAYGIAQALQGEWNQAALALAAAAREQPGNARYQSDAAAVYLERARAEGRADHLIKALAAAERSRLADPGLAEAWFNRALALERLSLDAQARAAWAEYLRRDARSPWASEARTHLANLEQAAAPSPWPAIRERLREGVDPNVADEAVRLNASEARLLLERELWPAWTAVVISGRSGTAERESLRVMSEALLRITGDALYRDAVNAIDRAEIQGGAALEALASAHAAYADAGALIAQDRFSDALDALPAARAALAAAGSPFAVRAALDVAAAAYYSSQRALFEETVGAVESRGAADSYRFIAARAAWVRGLAAFSDGRFGDVRRHWEQMLGLGDAMGDFELQAAAHGLLANLHQHLGDAPAAWQHRAASLERLPEVWSDRTRFGLLISAAGHALGEEDPAAALALQEEVVATAQRTGRSAAMPDALAQRASIHAALGDAAEAEADLTGAWTALSSVTDPSLRARLETTVLSAEVRVREATGDPRAITVAARAIRLIEGRSETARLPALHLTLGQAHLRQQRFDAARQAAESGLAVVAADQRPAAGGGEGRHLAELAMRAALGQGDVEAAFRFGVASRFHGGAGLADTTRAAVQARLAPGEALVTLNQLDDELVLWVVTPTRIQPVVRALSREDSDRLVRRQADEITMGARNPRASAALYDEIVRPALPQLRGVTRVIVAADAPYFAASFPAFWDPVRRRFWIEDVELAVIGRLDAGAGAPPLGNPSTVVEASGSPTPDAVFAAWRQAPPHAVVHVPALAAANNDSPPLSRVVFADLPGQPYSGTIVARDVAALPRVRAVLLPRVDPGAKATSGSGSYDVASAFLSAGTDHVISAIAANTTDAGLAQELRQRLEGSTSVVAEVAGFQRDVLRSSGQRLGAWSRLVVYGAGR